MQSDGSQWTCQARGGGLARSCARAGAESTRLTNMTLGRLRRVVISLTVGLAALLGGPKAADAGTPIPLRAKICNHWVSASLVGPSRVCLTVTRSKAADALTSAWVELAAAGWYGGGSRGEGDHLARGTLFGCTAARCKRGDKLPKCVYDFRKWTPVSRKMISSDRSRSTGV